MTKETHCSILSHTYIHWNCSLYVIYDLCDITITQYVECIALMHSIT